MAALSATALVLAARAYDRAALEERMRTLGFHVEHCAGEPRLAIEEEQHAHLTIAVIDLAARGDAVLLGAISQRVSGWRIAVVPDRAQFAAALLGGADAAIADGEWDVLAAQVLAFMRRDRGVGAETEQGSSSPLRLGNLEVDEGSFTISADGSPLSLTPIQYRMLASLIRRAGEVVSPAELMAEASPGLMSTRQLIENAKTHIMRIRRQLGAAGATVEIVTRRDLGYLIVEK